MPTLSSFAHQVPTILPLGRRVAAALRVLRSGTATPNNADQAAQAEQSHPRVDRQSDGIDDVPSTEANLRASREATERLVQHGWNLGQVPYGYQPVPVPQGRHTRVRLVPDLPAARAVTIIFHDYVHCQRGLAEIRDHVVRAGYPAPVLRRTGRRGAWTTSAVRAILRNPKYTGYQVWGRHHRGQPVPAEHWVWSQVPAHRALITPETFAAAQLRLQARSTASSTPRPCEQPPQP